MTADRVVLILLADPLNSRSLIEVKLLRLYKEHNNISIKIIELLGYIAEAASEDNEYKLEQYSLIEKDFINHLVRIKRVIKGFEGIGYVASRGLELSRLKAAQNEKLILDMGKRNRNTIKSSLKKITAHIELFSRKMIYTSSLLRQTTPVFIDLSV